MSWLPEGTILGTLVIRETLVFYDGPRLFICESDTDELFLAAWAHEGAIEDLWLYVPISREAGCHPLGGLTVRDAIINPEGFLFLVRLPHAIEGTDSVQPVRPGDVQETWLPDPDFRLSIDTPTLPTAEPGVDIERLARQEGRTRFRVRVHLPDYNRTEAPTRQIGEILISQHGTQHRPRNCRIFGGTIPQEIARKMRSDVVGLSAASFVLELASADFGDLFGGPLFADSTQKVLQLLDHALGQADLTVALLKTLRPRGAKASANLLRSWRRPAATSRWREPVFHSTMCSAIGPPRACKSSDCC